MVEDARQKGQFWFSEMQYSCLENPMEGGALVSESDTAERLNFHFSVVLVWRIPGTGEPGRLPSLGSHRVGHD